MSSIEPYMRPAKIAGLRPTQMTVGMKEVELKRKRWKEMGKKEREDYLSRHMVPVVIGPGEKFYLIDHHHEGLALLKEGQKELLVQVHADLSKLSPKEFWAFMDSANWCHPFDGKGDRRLTLEMPKRLMDLKDDPWRSLAAEVRRAGGYAKTEAPFSEFRWADFLRRRLKELNLDEAVKLAKSKKARHLPGWCGVEI